MLATPRTRSKELLLVSKVSSILPPDRTLMLLLFHLLASYYTRSTMQLRPSEHSVELGEASCHQTSRATQLLRRCRESRAQTQLAAFWGLYVLKLVAFMWRPGH